MLFKLWLFPLLCACGSLFSAGPTLHLWTAERFCEIYSITDPTALEEIVIGTEFPDIRYISPISRDETHPHTMSIQEVLASKTPFEMGMRLHAWLDIARENFIPREVYAAIIPHANGSSATLLKFLEEEILADFYDGRKWSASFDKALSEELSFAEENTVRKWHSMIQWTMSARPSWLLWAQSYRNPAFGVSVETLYNWSYFLPEQRQNPFFQQYVEALLKHIDEELRKC